MEVEAKARYMRIAPRKARLVADTVVGLPVKEALTILQFTPRAAAKEVAKVVKSAAANASNNFSQDEDDLVVKSIIVNEGPTLKRGRARARGMYFSIFKRTCHITAVVDTIAPAVAPSRRRRVEETVSPSEDKKGAKPAKAPKAETKAGDDDAGPDEEVEVLVEEARAEEVEADGPVEADVVAEPEAAEPEAAAEPVAEAAPEPVSEPVSEPLAEAAAEPAVEAAPEVVSELEAEVAAETVAETAPETVVEPAAESAVEPAVEAATDDSTDGSPKEK